MFLTKRQCLIIVLSSPQYRLLGKYTVGVHLDGVKVPQSLALLCIVEDVIENELSAALAEVLWNLIFVSHASLALVWILESGSGCRWCVVFVTIQHIE